MKEKIRKFFLSGQFDYCAVGFGILSIILLLAFDCNVLNCVLIYLNAIMGFCYYGYALYLLFCKATLFDWHLINGAFLRKVFILVLLTPFIFTLFNIKGTLHLVTVPNNIDPNNYSPLMQVLYHFIDPGNLHVPEKSPSYLVFFIAVLGVFLVNGLLVSSIVGWIDKRKTRWLSGEESYKRFLKREKHYVIIGGNEMVIATARQILEDGEKNRRIPYVLIQTSQNVEEFRRRLFACLSLEMQKHVIIHYGDRDSQTDVDKLCINSAIELYIIGEDTQFNDKEKYYHDQMSMKCLNYIYHNIKYNTSFAKKDKDNRLVCYFMFEHQTISKVIQYSNIIEGIKHHINFKPFYYYEILAQRVLVCKELENEANCEYLPLEGIEGIKKDDKDYVHLVIVGMTRMGTALATQAALMAHYPNFVEKGIRTKITLIDENADKEKNFFMGKYDRLFALSNWSYKEMVRSESGKGELKTVFTHTPMELEHLGGDFLDVEWEFIQGTVAQLDLQKYIEDCASKTRKMTIAICKDEPSRCLAAALNLEWRIYDKAMQVLVYNRYDDALIEKLKTYGEYSISLPFGNKLKAFGMTSKCFYDSILKDSEFFVGEFENVYTNGKSREPQNITNYWSDVYSSNTMWTKLRCVEIENEEIKAEDKKILAKVEHNRWNIERLLMSFRPLSKEEQDRASKDPQVKKLLKGEMAHLDICSNDRLEVVDKNAIKYDEAFAEELIRIKKDFEVKKK